MTLTLLCAGTVSICWGHGGGWTDPTGNENTGKSYPEWACSGTRENEERPRRRVQEETGRDENPARRT